MKILLQDYGAYPFVVQLGEELAARGHSVTHAYCASLPTTPSGLGSGDSSLVRRAPIQLSSPISKGALLQRFLLEREYGRKLQDLIRCEKPEIVVMANTPIDSFPAVVREVRRVDARLIVWVQDLLGEAMQNILSTKLGSVGRMIGVYYAKKENFILKGASHLIAITDDFLPVFRRAGVPADRCTTIANWAPLGDIVPSAKDNAWSRAQKVHETGVFLYSGTLGFKHNPSLLLALARKLKHQSDAVLLVNSTGDAADWLRNAAIEERLTDVLKVNGFQPFHQMSAVLASADVVLVILDPAAGRYSVPSKVLTNLCAGRAQLLAVPASNLAAQIVQDSRAGIVVDPTDEAEFVEKALELYNDNETRAEMGKRARDYAAHHFDIHRIADEFEAVFRKTVHDPSTAAARS